MEWMAGMSPENLKILADLAKAMKTLPDLKLEFLRGYAEGLASQSPVKKTDMVSAG